VQKSKYGVLDPISKLLVRSPIPQFTRHNTGEVLDYLTKMDFNKRIKNSPIYGEIVPLKEDSSLGMKYDGGKIIAGVILEDFPNAITGVCEVATFGANKYKRSSWQSVPNAIQRYTDAMMRHQLAKGRGETIDPESGLPHSYHIACNGLAIIELENVSNNS